MLQRFETITEAKPVGDMLLAIVSSLGSLVEIFSMSAGRAFQGAGSTWKLPNQPSPPRSSCTQPSVSPWLTLTRLPGRGRQVTKLCPYRQAKQ